MLRSWIHLGIITLLLLGVYVYTDIYIALLALVIMLSLAVSSMLLLLLIKRQLVVELESNWSTYKTEEGTIHIKLKNKGILPITQVKCVLLFHNLLTEETMTKETYVMTKGKAEIVVPLHFNSTQIGKIEVSVQRLIVYDYLHLSAWSIYSNVKNSTYIIPHQTPIHFIESHKRFGIENGRQLTNDEIDSAGMNMVGIKEYQEGDNAKHMHWKLTNKFNIPIIKEFSEPMNENVLVLYDTFHSGNSQAINSKIEVFMSLSKSLIDQGYEHELSWMDHHTKSVQNEDIHMVEQFISLQSTILSIKHQNQNSKAFCDLIRDSLHYYSHIYVITSEANQEIEAFRENHHVTILMYSDESTGQQALQMNHVLFSSDTLQKDLSYLTM